MKLTSRNIMELWEAAKDDGNFHTMEIYRQIAEQHCNCKVCGHSVFEHSMFDCSHETLSTTNEVVVCNCKGIELSDE